MRLTREIRFSVGGALDSPKTNSWAGWPTSAGIQPFLALQAVIEGTPDPVTGYLCNIQQIDRILRDHAIAVVDRLVAEGGGSSESVIRAIAETLHDQPPAGTQWISFTMFTTPFVQYSITTGAPDMVDVTQSFEFAAAHRLHCAALTDAENRKTFGKCNNPNGHGHNYRLDVTITGVPQSDAQVVLPLTRFEQIVNERVIEVFDHKHLNMDCPEFADVNPSVENIAQVIWSKLEGRFTPARLKQVRLYETPKTWADVVGA